MENILRAFEKRVLRLDGADVAHFDGEVRVPGVRLEVLRPAADHVIDDADAEALLQEQVHHVAADEPGAARDHRDAHWRFSAFTVRTLM